MEIVNKYYLGKLRFGDFLSTFWRLEYVTNVLSVIVFDKLLYPTCLISIQMIFLSMISMCIN